MVSVAKLEKGNNKKGSSVSGGGICSYCCRFLVLVAVVLGGVLVLDAYEYISVKAAKDARTTLYTKMAELDPAIIEQQIGMKILNMEDYNKLINEMTTTKQQYDKLSSDAAQQKMDLDAAREVIVQKEALVTTLVTERDAVQGRVNTITSERDNLAQQVATLTSEKDALSTQVATLTTERDALKEAANKPENVYVTEPEAAKGGEGDAATAPQVRQRKLKGL